MKARKTKQNQIDELKAALAERNAWAAKHIQAGDDRIKSLESEKKGLQKQDTDIRLEITVALGLADYNQFSPPQLPWPQIYVELGKLIQIKELHYPKKEKVNYPTAC